MRKRPHHPAIPPVPPFSPVCGLCGGPSVVLGPIFCAECQPDINELQARMKDLEARREAGLVPPFSSDDVFVIVAANTVGLRIEMHNRLAQQDYEKKIQEWGGQRDWREHLTGRKLKPSTQWLREHHQGRSMKLVYPEWLIEDDSDDTPESWKRFRALWRREIGGKK